MRVEGRAWLERVLAAMRSPSLQPCGLGHCSRQVALAQMQDDVDRATALLAEGEALATAVGDRQSMIDALFWRARPQTMPVTPGPQSTLL